MELGSLVDDRYRVGPVLGSGGMGVVYRAVEVGPDLEVALKVMRSNSRSARARRQFFNEATMTKQIQDPGVVQILDFGVDDEGHCFIAMELLDGERLSDQLAAQGPLTLEGAREVLTELARILGAAHDRGLLHCDVKPENLVRTGDGALKLLDFGLGVRVERVKYRDASDGVEGSPAYLAPEVLRSETVGPFTDVYSLGLVFQWLLTGETAATGDSVAELLRCHVTGALRPIPTLFDHPPTQTAVQSFIARCVALDPQDRFQDMGQVMSALGAIPVRPAEPAESHEPSLETRLESPTKEAEAVGFEPQPLSRLPGAVVVGVGLLGGLLLLYLYG